MSIYQDFNPMDLLRINEINIDVFTATFPLNYYQRYLAVWPDLFFVEKQPSGMIGGYNMSKVEGDSSRWHGHVSALTVSSHSRRGGLAQVLMSSFEQLVDKKYECFFNDLYVRVDNLSAISMYKNLGYSVFRRVLNYYGVQDAFDMRKSTRTDPKYISQIPFIYPSLPNIHDCN